MSSSILHSCPFCGHVTDIAEVLADFVENPHCRQCGLSASEGNLKLQDDLVALFNRQMNMEASPSPQQQQQQQQQQEKEEEVHVSAPPKITYSITQHYHHSSHLVQPPTAPQPPPQSTATPRYNATANWVNRILGHNGIEPSSLTPGQLELFANAMPEQQSRLIQIWQICPQPSRNAQSLPSSSHFPSAGAFDMHMHDSMVPERDGRDGDDEAQGYAEPYMISGYGLGGQESAAHKAAPLATEPSTGFPYRLSNDPIYQTPGQRWWERTQAGSMEY